MDLATDERWSVRPNLGRVPWWILAPRRRVPHTRAIEYLALSRLLWVNKRARIPEVIDCRRGLYDRLWRPLLLAALNTDPHEASAGLAGAVVRETLLAGGRACRPLVALAGLAATFIDPALSILGDAISFGRRTSGDWLWLRADRGTQLGAERIRLGARDAVILAVPPWVAANLVPQLRVPTDFRAILNAHFRITPPANAPVMTGVVNGVTEWIFCFPDRVAVTISGADRLLDAPRDRLAASIWGEVATVLGLAARLPAWQIIKERRATFAASPLQDAMRPGPITHWNNLLLAGDWTATGLPATIEGAIRSGNRAAELALRQVE